MNLVKISRLQAMDGILNRVQDNIINPLNQILGNPIVPGNILLGQVLAVGDNTVNHGLGRALQGWIIIGITAAVSIFDKQATNTATQTTLILNASGVVTVNLYVF